MYEDWRNLQMFRFHTARGRVAHVSPLSRAPNHSILLGAQLIA